MVSLKSFFRIIKFKLESFLFKRLIKSSNAWQLFDQAGIEGFGTNLYRLYFPIYYDLKTKRESFSEGVIKKITALLSGRQYDSYSDLIANEIESIIQLPVQEIDVVQPYLDNYFFGIYDAAILSAMMQSFKPDRIFEIGSGISTRYMKYFKQKHHLATQIICVDPAPRVNIQNVADTIIMKPLETVLAEKIIDLQSGDILFMDGSHYVFQGNDTLSFFFQLLPGLPKNVLIHIHDVYLPNDYPENASRQLWAEQYLLAALMLGGFEGFEVVYPAYYLSQTDSRIKTMLKAADSLLDKSSFQTRANNIDGYSFWLLTV